MAGFVNQNYRFDLGARKLFFVPAPKIVLQQYRARRGSADHLPGGSAYSLMSFVKHREHDWNVLHAHQREVD